MLEDSFISEKTSPEEIREVPKTPVELGFSAFKSDTMPIPIGVRSLETDPYLRSEGNDRDIDARQSADRDFIDMAERGLTDKFLLSAAKYPHSSTNASGLYMALLQVELIKLGLLETLRLEWVEPRHKNAHTARTDPFADAVFSAQGKDPQKSQDSFDSLIRKLESLHHGFGHRFTQSFSYPQDGDNVETFSRPQGVSAESTRYRKYFSRSGLGDGYQKVYDIVPNGFRLVTNYFDEVLLLRILNKEAPDKFPLELLNKYFPEEFPLPPPEIRNFQIIAQPTSTDTSALSSFTTYVETRGDKGGGKLNR